MLNNPSPYNKLGAIIFFYFCLGLNASAQKLFTVKGVVFKKNTPITISIANVTNISRKIPETTSDELGSFHIQAALGDTLLFKKADYTPQFIVVQSYMDQSVYMQPVIHLNEVDIKDISKRQALSNVMDDYKKKGQYYSLDPSVGSVLTSPITGLYELFGKGASQARKFRQYSKEEMERIEVSKRYNRPLVKKITNIPDTDIEDFMIAFTPNVEDIRIWSDYDIATYIKKSYAYFIDNKSSLKIQKLY
jgi:hypothetical protein